MLAVGNEKLTQLQTLICGGSAGCFTRAICQPLDVLKIRFQLQTEPLEAGSKYSSMRQALRTIVQEEGVKALWSGHVPAQFLSIIYGFVQFSSYEFLTDFSAQYFPQACNQYMYCVNFVDGSIAASAATVCSFPFDTIRTRLIAEQKAHPVYNSVLVAFAKMLKSEGFFSLYNGLIPALVQIAPQAGIQYMVYKTITDKLPKLQHKFKKVNTHSPNTLTFIIAGSMSGLVAKSVMYPFDLAKKRLQIQGFQKYRGEFGKQIVCGGLTECFVLTVKSEGVMALYKGMGPGVIKAMIATALQFTIYEEMKLLFLKFG